MEQASTILFILLFTETQQLPRRWLWRKKLPLMSHISFIYIHLWICNVFHFNHQCLRWTQDLLLKWQLLLLIFEHIFLLILFLKQDLNVQYVSSATRTITADIVEWWHCKIMELLSSLLSNCDCWWKDKLPTPALMQDH